MQDCCSPAYPYHGAQIARLNRAAGQIAGVKGMIEDRRYCPDILIQLRAIRAAIQAVEANILEVHLGACFGQAFKASDEPAQQEKIREIIALFQRSA